MSRAVDVTAVVESQDEDRRLSCSGLPAEREDHPPASDTQAILTGPSGEFADIADAGVGVLSDARSDRRCQAGIAPRQVVESAAGATRPDEMAAALAHSPRCWLSRASSSSSVRYSPRAISARPCSIDAI